MFSQVTRVTQKKQKNRLSHSNLKRNSPESVGEAPEKVTLGSFFVTSVGCEEKTCNLYRNCILGGWTLLRDVSMGAIFL